VFFKRCGVFLLAWHQWWFYNATMSKEIQDQPEKYSPDIDELTQRIFGGLSELKAKIRELQVNFTAAAQHAAAITGYIVSFHGVFKETVMAASSNDKKKEKESQQAEEKRRATKKNEAFKTVRQDAKKKDARRRGWIL